MITNRMDLTQGERRVMREVCEAGGLVRELLK